MLQEGNLALFPIFDVLSLNMFSHTKDKSKLNSVGLNFKLQEEEKLAREKIRAQIAQDREERAARFDAEKQAELAARAEQEKRQREEAVAEAERLAAERW